MCMYISMDFSLEEEGSVEGHPWVPPHMILKSSTSQREFFLGNRKCCFLTLKRNPTVSVRMAGVGQCELPRSISPRDEMPDHFKEGIPTGGHLEICSLWAVLRVLEGKALCLSLGCKRQIFSKQLSDAIISKISAALPTTRISFSSLAHQQSLQNIMRFA